MYCSTIIINFINILSVLRFFLECIKLFFTWLRHCTLGGKASQVQIKHNSYSQRSPLAMLLTIITKIITAKVFVVIKRISKKIYYMYANFSDFLISCVKKFFRSIVFIFIPLTFLILFMKLYIICRSCLRSAR